MKRFVLLAALLFGCSSGESSVGDDGNPVLEGAPTTVTKPSSAPPGTFTYVYETYFATGTAGHCSNCHGRSARGGFFSGTTKDDFYAGLTEPNSRLGAPLVDQTDPARSLILDSKRSPVAWFNPSGPMPDDAPQPNARAKADIDAWIANGAKND